MNNRFMIEADYPPGTLIFVDNGYDRHGMTTPIRHKLAKVTHIKPTDPFLDKPIIEIDLSKIPDYAQEILYMKEEIEERREDAWDEQETIRAAAAAAAAAVHVPVPRGGSPGFRLSRRTPQALAPLSDNARFEQFQADINRERAENIRLIRREQTRRREDMLQERDGDRVRRRINDNNNIDPAPVPVRMNDNSIPLGRNLAVPMGGRKSRRGRKSKKSRKRRSRRRGRR
jgi:hypothetical protein